MPVLSVRLKLRAREEARIEAERLAILEAAAAEKEEEKRPTTPSYLKPLNKIVKEKTLAEPPPRLLMLRKARAKTDPYNAAKRRDVAKSRRTASRGRSSTARGRFSAKRDRAARPRSGSTQSVPRYMQETGGRGREHMRSTDENAPGRRFASSSLWRPGKSTDQKPKAGSLNRRGRRRNGRGRSRSANGSRGGTPGSWFGHVPSKDGSSSAFNKSGGGRSSSKSARRTKRSISPSHSAWQAMGTIVQAEPPLLA